MSSRRYPLIAREGWFLMSLCGVLAVVAYVVVGPRLGTAGLVFVGILGFLFRDPPRTVPAAPLAIVSPCAGEIQAVGEAHDPWLERDALRIRVRMGWFDTYRLSSPMEGKVQQHWCKTGEAEHSPFRWGTRHTVWLRTDEGEDIVLSVAVTHSLGKLNFYFNPGERIGQGQRCGFLFFGGRAELFLPSGTVAECEIGQRVTAGEDILAKLQRQSAPAAASA